MQSRFWLWTFGLTSVASFFGARGVGSLLGASLAADARQLSAAPIAANAAQTPGRDAEKAKSADAILSRNPFDSVTGPILAGHDVEVGPTDSAPCTGVKVLGIAASSDPEWSFAVLETPGESRSVLRRRGGDFGGKYVAFVGWDRVWLASGGGLCQASLFDRASAGVSAARASAVPELIAKGIVRVGPTEINIDRGVVDKIIENQAELMKQVRIVPEQQGGSVLGVRLFGVHPDTLLGILGFENGDRLQSIAGFDITSPEQALLAYARLRTADHLTVQVNRKGASLNLDYDIR